MEVAPVRVHEKLTFKDEITVKFHTSSFKICIDQELLAKFIMDIAERQSTGMEFLASHPFRATKRQV